MIKYERFTYADEHWSAIREQVLADLGVDADTVERSVSIRFDVPDYEEFRGDEVFTGTQSLRERIEIAVRQYRLHGDADRLSPRREELNTLREDAVNLRDSILDTVAVPFDAGYGVVVPARLSGVDGDMLTETRDYFRKLVANLDRMIALAGSSSANARKTARDLVWNDLLVIWRELGGKKRGVAAAEFLKLASLPVMGSAVPDLASVRRWLDRRPE